LSPSDEYREPPDPGGPQPYEHCAYCGKFAPASAVPPGAKDSPQSEQGWVRFEGRSTIVINVPYPGPAILPPELVTRVRELLADPAHEQSFVCIDPHSLTQPANIREVLAGFTGALVCADCMTETGWDYPQWVLFLSGLRS